MNEGWHLKSDPPEERGWYLVTVKASYLYVTDAFYDGYNWGKADFRIIAWREMPEPYQPEEEVE